MITLQLAGLRNLTAGIVLASSSLLFQALSPAIATPNHQPLATDAPFELAITASTKTAARLNVSSPSIEELALIGMPELPTLVAPDRYLPNTADPHRYLWPTKGVITSGFGWRWGRMHQGIDIAAPIGTPIYASASGTVVDAGWTDGGYGNLVTIKHDDGSSTLYGHNNRVLVHEGQQVEQGQLIAEMGSTGRSTGPHSHFEIRMPKKGAVNPIAYLTR